MSYEWVYLRRMQGHRSEPMLNYENFPTLTAVEDRWREVEKQLRAYVASLDEQSLHESVEYDSASGGVQRNSRLQLLQHVANHGTDHRAQILVMLHMMGAETMPQDFIYYLRETG